MASLADSRLFADGFARATNEESLVASHQDPTGTFSCLLFRNRGVAAIRLTKELNIQFQMFYTVFSPLPITHPQLPKQTLANFVLASAHLT